MDRIAYFDKDEFERLYEIISVSTICSRGQLAGTFTYGEKEFAIIAAVGSGKGDGSWSSLQAQEIIDLKEYRDLAYPKTYHEHTARGYYGMKVKFKNRTVVFRNYELTIKQTNTVTSNYTTKMRKYRFDHLGSCDNPCKETVYRDQVITVKVLTAASGRRWVWGYEILNHGPDDFLHASNRDTPFSSSAEQARGKALSYLVKEYPWNKLIKDKSSIEKVIVKLRSIISGVVTSDCIVSKLGKDAWDRQGIKRKVERLANKLIELQPLERKAILLRVNEHFSKSKNP